MLPNNKEVPTILTRNREKRDKVVEKPPNVLNVVVANHAAEGPFVIVSSER